MKLKNKMIHKDRTSKYVCNKNKMHKEFSLRQWRATNPVALS